MAKHIRTYAIISCLMFLTLLVGLDSTRVAVSEEHGDDISTPTNEKLGWPVCSYYDRPGLHYCCCRDQSECFDTVERCIQYCDSHPRICTSS
ncbi:hypothetical protein HanXRQr2_Chr14g0620751 [Helianthus annuus]|uniref:Uncharacterized protein n=1 Tax=Helianthus annuus TaxID=4232 RepID=A0A251SE95_HELAN|nr:hypothetical protein HanXRQr2_Chr14g0620751 [Helianthus annuus]KAJ0838501.1 hypothetical protein HanPSC8_Chr14g0595561 [Helianthus annuus]